MEYYTTAVLHWQAAIKRFVMKCLLTAGKCFAAITLTRRLKFPRQARPTGASIRTTASSSPWATLSLTMVS